MNDRDGFLLVSPPYDQVGVAESVSSASVVLSIAMLAAQCRDRGRSARVLDLNLERDWELVYDNVLREMRPTHVGITFATPLANISQRLGDIAHDYGAYVIGGGPHATAEPADTMRDTGFDALVVGEGEQAFGQFLDGGDPAVLPGWHTRRTLIPRPGDPVEDLDALPFAAVDMFDADRYQYPTRAARRNPVCLIETSRGCYARCTFCNKNIFGWTIRKKSASRVVDEIEFMLASGFAELHIADDLFTADYDHASGVCKEIIARGLDFPWVPRSGLRVDRVRPELLELMKEAGCYHIPLGIESGDQAILKRIRKGITIAQVERAVHMVHNAGMEATGYFMVGIPGETMETMDRTLEFATSLELEYIKVGICVPLPGTPLFAEVESQGMLRTRDWGRFTYSTPPWELLNSDTVTEENMSKLFIAGIPLLSAANRTLSRQDDGSYVLS